ncbi:hypothetical protein [Nucisporomicrobium flavum]|uniref:hypothetical protein n=1 Tax=Nucisporomicrobium flavum TaxID=2785915 RepID=UPI0018F5EB52|nr:hypothetical protein [Nucisporomicrobium flavum]
MTWWIVAAAALPAAIAAARPPRPFVAASLTRRSAVALPPRRSVAARLARRSGAAPALQSPVAADLRPPSGEAPRSGAGPSSGAAPLIGAASAIGAGLAVAAVYVAATVAGYLLVFPMEAHPVHAGVLLAVLPALAGATAGHLIGRRSRSRPGFGSVKAAMTGAALALFGALLLPGTVADAAQFSAVEESGPDLYTLGPGQIAVPAAGRYTLLGDGDPPPDPGCRLIRAGAADVRAEPLTVQPEEAGYDATAGFRTIADVDVAVAGIYGLTCSSPGDGTGYRLVRRQSISPVADSLMRWPLSLIMLLGALPGLVLVAGAAGGSRSE